MKSEIEAIYETYQGRYPGDLLPVDDVSYLSGLMKSTLDTYRSRGGGPPYLKIGRRIGYPLRQFCQWLDENSWVSW